MASAGSSDFDDRYYTELAAAFVRGTLPDAPPLPPPELVQFGLMPEFIGQGLGRYFLQWTIDRAWNYRPRRFWLHTCTKDHPAALPNYFKAGFAIYKEEVKDQG